MDIETTLAGKLKLLSLVLGGLSVALSGPSLCRHTTRKYVFECDGGSYSKEQYFLAISCIALIASFLLVLMTVLNLTKRISRWSLLDAGYHLLMAILLLLGWIVFVISVDYNHKAIVKYVPDFSGDKEYISYMARRCFALIFQLINIVVYSTTAFLVYKNRNKSRNLN